VQKKWLTLIATSAVFLLVLAFTASGCLPQPAELSGQVIISDKIESRQVFTVPLGYDFWIVKLSITNRRYDKPIEIGNEPFGGQTPWTIQSYQHFTYSYLAGSEPVTIERGESGNFTALFVFPSNLPVKDVLVAYQGQGDISNCGLALKDRVAVYDWDTKTVITPIPRKSPIPLVATILFSILLLAVRWYPEVFGHELRPTKSRLQKILYHKLIGIIVVVASGISMYYLYPFIGPESVAVSFVVASPIWYTAVDRVLWNIHESMLEGTPARLEQDLSDEEHRILRNHTARMEQRRLLEDEEAESERDKGQELPSPQQTYEAEIQESIVKNIGILENGLQVIEQHKKIYKDNRLIGEIDILCRDMNGDYVVVELKRNKASHKVAGQIGTYLGWVAENESKGGKTRGIIVASKVDEKLAYAISTSKFQIQIKQFGDVPPLERNMRHCDKCGKLIPKSARICSHCGNKPWM
jgi:hypothetical protein